MYSAFQSNCIQLNIAQIVLGEAAVTIRYGDPLPEVRYERESVRKKPNEIRKSIESAYTRLFEAKVETAAEIVKPFVKAATKAAPPPTKVNFELLARDMEKVNRLLALAERLSEVEGKKHQQEEEAFMMLLAM